MKQRMLVDVHFETLNFHPRIVITRHVCERLVERKIDIANFILLLKSIAKQLCERIYECVYRGAGTIVVGYGVKIPLSFQQESMKLFVRTVY
jgi:hypothetical protein